MNFNAILVLVGIGALLGGALGIANKHLLVEEDDCVQDVIAMLPGVNCGGCGYPGCAGFAQALIDKDVQNVSVCIVSNQETREKITSYLNDL